MPLSPIPPILPTSTYEHLVLEALGEIAIGSTINYNPPILDTALFRHLVLNALQYIANNPGGGGSGTVTSITAGTGLTGGTITTTGTIAVSYGTTAETATQGNDTRVVNAVQKTGGTMTGTLVAAADATISKLNIGNALTGVSAPATTVDGDIWISTSNKLAYKSNGNFYTPASISLANAFTSTQSIEVTSANTALRVTQKGTGEAFRVEDDPITPDTTPFVISNAGRVGIGVTPDASVALSVDTTGIKFGDGTIQTTAASGVPTGTAGGDLSGNYPDPNVNGLQGTPVSNATPYNGQVLQYNGTSWVPGTIPSSGGGGGIYYLNFNTAADAPVTSIPQTPNATKELGIAGETTATSYQSPILSTSTYDFLASFVTDLGVPATTSVPAGIWDFSIFAESTTTNSANQIYLRIEVFKYDGVAAPVFLARSNDTYIYDPAEINQYIVSVVMPQTTILTTDRIVVYIYGRAHQNNRHLTLHFGGQYPSHAHTTIPPFTGSAVVNGGGVPTVIEVTEAQYAALTPAQVDQTATYIVNSTTTQNATTYQGKEFGGSKPVSLLAQPVVVGSINRVSPTISIGSIDWIQVSPIDPTKFYFSQNIGGGASAAMWRGTLTRDSANKISGGINSYGGQQAAAFDIYNGTKGGGIYDADTVFIPDEKNLSTDSTGFGRILKVNLATATATDAWNFQTSTPAVVRADNSTQNWYPDDCMVDRANNKLFVGSGSIVTTTSQGTSVARFSIDPSTKTLSPDGWVKVVTPNGSGINLIRRLILLPDGYIFVSNHNQTTNTASFQTFDAYGSASGNATSVGISYASGNVVQGAAFKADVNAPSGIGYILIAPRGGNEKGKIYAYDYQGLGVVNTTATNSTDLTTIGKNAGLWTNGLTLEIGAISVAPDGAILVGLRSGTTTPIPRSVIAFNWIPYAKSGTLSTQNSDNVSITGGSINGVRNLTPKVEYINASRSWWKDEAAKFIRVQAWSGGGGGGSGRKDSTANVVRSGGGGGGGGGYIDILMDASTVVTTTVPVTITIGGGGAGGAAQTTNAVNGNNGTQGGNTSWSSVLTVLGGSGGFGGSLTDALGGTGSLNGNSGGYSAGINGVAGDGFPGSIIAPIGVGGTGGGAGGGLNSSNSALVGAKGGISFYGVLGTAAAGGATNGGNGAAGNNVTTGIYQVGGGGGGGGAHTTGNGGTGGAGGFGSGGGGGGASQLGNSGAGGNGGNGFMIVTTYY